MASSWPEEVLHELEQAQKILRGLETRLRQAKAADLLAMASFVEANAPEPPPAQGATVIQPPNRRQDWCLQQLWAGQPLTRKMIERQFNVTEKTAKRDLNELMRLKLITYIRIPRPGRYELRLRDSKRGAPADNGNVPQNADGDPGDYQV
jgi:predicted HTH transcriptional regulator